MNTQYMTEKLDKIHTKIYEIITSKFSDEVVKTNYKAYIDKFYNSNNVGFAQFNKTIFPELEEAIFIASSQFNKQDSIVEVSVDGKNQAIDIKNLLDELKKENIFVCMEPIAPFYKLLRLNENLDFTEVPDRDLKNQHMITKNTCCERLIIENISWIYSNYQAKAIRSNDSDKLKGLIEVYCEAEKEKMTGVLHLYTKFEPCLYCYGTLKEFKDRNPELQLKVYHSYVRDEFDRVITMSEDMTAKFDSEMVESFKMLFANRIPLGLTPEEEKAFVIQELENLPPNNTINSVQGW